MGTPLAGGGAASRPCRCTRFAPEHAAEGRVAGGAPYDIVGKRGEEVFLESGFGDLGEEVLEEGPG